MHGDRIRTKRLLQPQSARRVWPRAAWAALSELLKLVGERHGWIRAFRPDAAGVPRTEAAVPDGRATAARPASSLLQRPPPAAGPDGAPSTGVLATGILTTLADRREHALGLAIFLVDGGIAGAECTAASNTAAAARKRRSGRIGAGREWARTKRAARCRGAHGRCRGAHGRGRMMHTHAAAAAAAKRCC